MNVRLTCLALALFACGSSTADKGQQGDKGDPGEPGATGAVGATGIGLGAHGFAHTTSDWLNTTTLDMPYGTVEQSFPPSAAGHPCEIHVFVQATDDATRAKTAVSAGTWTFQIDWLFQDVGGQADYYLRGPSFDLVFDGTNAGKTLTLTSFVPSPSQGNQENGFATKIPIVMRLMNRTGALPVNSTLHMSVDARAD